MSISDERICQHHAALMSATVLIAIHRVLDGESDVHPKLRERHGPAGSRPVIRCLRIQDVGEKDVVVLHKI